jgi:hypothetical protein
VPPQILEAAQELSSHLARGEGSTDAAGDGEPLLRPEEVFPFLAESRESASAAAVGEVDDAVLDRAAAGVASAGLVSSKEEGKGSPPEALHGAEEFGGIRDSGSVREEDAGSGVAAGEWSEAALFLDEYLASVERLGPVAGGVTSLRLQLQRQGVIPNTSAMVPDARGAQPDIPAGTSSGSNAPLAPAVAVQTSTWATDTSLLESRKEAIDEIGGGEEEGPGHNRKDVLSESSDEEQSGQPGVRVCAVMPDVPAEGLPEQGGSARPIIAELKTTSLNRSGTGTPHKCQEVARGNGGANRLSAAVPSAQVNCGSEEKFDRRQAPPLEMHSGRQWDSANAELQVGGVQGTGRGAAKEMEEEELWLRGRDWQQRDGKGVARARAAATMWSRVLRRPLKRGRHVVLDLCVAAPDQRSGALERHIVAWSDRHRPWLGPAAYRLARRLSVGDLWPTVYHKNYRVRRWN